MENVKGIRFFRSAGDFRRWLEANAGGERELVLGFNKTGAGLGGITYQEALDEALCVGWIDGVRRSLDESRYTIRFTPRKARSRWSAVNIRRVGELEKLGRMTPSGLRAFSKRDPATSGYAYADFKRDLDRAALGRFRANRRAWRFFESQAPSYRRIASWWVMSAKKEETRARRLESLIEHSAKGQRPPGFIPTTKRGKEAAAPGRGSPRKPRTR